MVISLPNHVLFLATPNSLRNHIQEQYLLFHWKKITIIPWLYLSSGFYLEAGITKKQTHCTRQNAMKRFTYLCWFLKWLFLWRFLIWFYSLIISKVAFCNAQSVLKIYQSYILQVCTGKLVHFSWEVLLLLV